MRKILIALAVVICLWPSRLRADEVSLTLADCRAIALRDNKEVLLKTEDIHKAQARVAEGEAGRWPSLNITAGQSHSEGNLAGLSAVSASTRGLGDLTTGQASVKQYLYQGGKITNTIAVNKFKLDAAEAVLAKTELELALSVQQAFYTLLLAQEFFDLNAAIAANTERHLASVETRYQNGQASDLDVLRIKESLENARYMATESGHEVEAVQALMRNLLSLAAEVVVRPAGEFSYEPKEMAIEEGFLQALQERPEIRQYEAERSAAEKNIAVAQAGGRPAVYASWDYYSNSRLLEGDGTWSNFQEAGITVTWPLFDGWATQARLGQAVAELKAAQVTKEKVVQDIARELSNAYVGMKNAIAGVKKAETALATFERSLTEIQEKTARGLASHLDREDAELSYRVALFNRKEAVANYLIAEGKFDKATGAFARPR